MLLIAIFANKQTHKDTKNTLALTKAFKRICSIIFDWKSGGSTKKRQVNSVVRAYNKFKLQWDSFSTHMPYSNVVKAQSCVSKSTAELTKCSLLTVAGSLSHWAVNRELSPLFFENRKEIETRCTYFTQFQCSWIKLLSVKRHKPIAVGT